MTKQNYIELVKEHKLQAIDWILDYIESQKDLWQKIPYLALYAYKGSPRIYTGYTERHKLAYTKGLWMITDNLDRIYIDCETGKLLKRRDNKIQEFLSHEENFFILNIDIKEFSAQNIIKNLKERQKMSDKNIFDDYPKKISGYKSAKKFREVMIEKYNLRKNYYQREQPAL